MHIGGIYLGDKSQTIKSNQTKLSVRSFDKWMGSIRLAHWLLEYQITFFIKSIKHISFHLLQFLH